MVAHLRMRSARQAGGFTIIEMAIVVVIIGLMAAIALPRIDLQKFQVDSAMQGLGTTLVAAQREAVSRQYDVIVMFDAGNNALRIHEDANIDGVVNGAERVRGVDLGEGIGFGLAGAPARTMGPGPVVFTQLRSGLPAVTFHRNGSASEAGGFYITSLRAINSGTRPQDARAIELERATGRVTWYKYVPPAWKRWF